MIRPVSLLCFIVAVVAGAWLYQVKHEAQLMDRDILRMQRQADLARDRIAILRAEWALLNLPDRLRDVAGRHLSLVKVEPSQYASMADFMRRVGGAEVVQTASASAVVAAPVSVRDSDAEPRDTNVRAEAVAAVPVAARVAPVVAQPQVAPVAPVRRPVAVVPVTRSAITQAVATVPSSTGMSRVAPQTRRESTAASVSAAVAGASALGGARSTLAPPVPVGAR